MSLTDKERKRKAGDEGVETAIAIELEIGMRIKSKFDHGEWYGGTVMDIGREKAGGEIVKILVEYDDGVEEECDWPDDSIFTFWILVNMKKNWGKKRRGKGAMRMSKIILECLFAYKKDASMNQSGRVF